MKNYDTRTIRNVALLGHGSSGKTTLIEALAFKRGAIERMGKVEEGTTLSDYDAEEQARKFSISAAVVPLEGEHTKINFIDAPGYFDFVAEQLTAIKAADAAIILVDGLAGAEVGTEKAIELLTQMNKPFLFVVNKLDREHVDFEKTCKSLKKLVGNKLAVFTAPVNAGPGFDSITDVISGAGYKFASGKPAMTETPEDIQSLYTAEREAIIEAAASVDEAAMEKYFNDEPLSESEMIYGIKTSIKENSLIPLVSISALTLVGLDNLLDIIENYLPSPAESNSIVKTHGARKAYYDDNAPFSAFVFKTIADPYVGKLSLFKVCSGSISAGTEVFNQTKGKKEKIAHLYVMQGKKQIEVQQLHSGDIGAFSKLTDTVTNDLLCDNKTQFDYEPIQMPQPIYFMGITPKSKNDEDKMSAGLARIREEDLTVRLMRNTETNQNLIYGMGEMHLDVVAKKLKSRYGVDVLLETPIIPFRETVKKAATVEGKHKKQSGGSGQFGVVNITFEPSNNLDVPLEFVDKVVGGSVPRNFIPAVEKGLNECVKEGTLAGYPVVGLKATLFDGKYHPVDSDEMSFKMAASIAYKEALPQCGVTLLEPIYKVEVTVPNDNVGDVMGDISKKRGRVLGTDPIKGERQIVIAEVPLAEMFKYATELRSMSQGRGSFTMDFVRYEEVPGAYQAKIIEEAKARKAK